MRWTSLTAIGLVSISLCVGAAWAQRRDPANPDRAARALEVPCLVKGLVTTVMVKDGDLVQAGQVLLRIDDRRARLAVERARAYVVLAEADLAVQMAHLRQAEVTLKRFDALMKSKAISIEEFEASRAALEKAQQEMVVKREMVKLKKLDVDDAQLRLEYHQVVCPAAGVVEAVLRKPGEAVKELEPVVRIKIKAP